MPNVETHSTYVRDRGVTVAGAGDLRRDEKLLAGHAGLGDRLSDVQLVVVCVRCRRGRPGRWFSSSAEFIFVKEREKRG